MSTPATECQRFFAFSKRVPKDVKRFCGICRQHGKLEETRGHNCEFKDCECPKCMLVRSRRLVMSQQIRLRRAQDKRFQRTTEPEEADVVPILSATTEAMMAQQQQQEPADQQDPKQQQQQLLDAKNMCYFCQKCKNHGILVWKKQHKRQCPFTTCTCDFCELIETRRRLDQHIKRRKSEPKNSGAGAASAAGDDSGDKSDGEDYIPRKKSTASLPAQIEAMAMAGTSGADLSAAASFWRYSPPGTVSIPIGIAQSRIAEQQEDQQQQQQQENPLDALAAQIMRIQRHSPSATSGGIESRQSPVSSLMAGSGGSHNCSPAPTITPSMLPMGTVMDQQQQQQLQQQLLLSLSSPASSTGPSLSTLADFSPLLATSSSPIAATAFNTQPMVSLEQMFATHPFATAQQQQQQQQQSPAATNPLNDALLGQLLLMGTTIPTLSELKMPPPPAAADVGGAVGSDPQRELLLQIIAQLLQDQQIMEQQQQQQNVQQQQQKSMLEALVANMHLNGATTAAAAASSMPNGAAVEQLQLQFQQLAALQAMNTAAVSDTNGATNGFDPTLMAALLMTQQQQQQQQHGQMAFPVGKDMSAATAFLLQAANNSAESAVINNSMANAASSRGQSQSPPVNAHQSAFTLLRPGFNMP